MEVGELAQLPWDVPETNAADFGFVSLLTNAAKKENKSVMCINTCFHSKFHHTGTIGSFWDTELDGKLK